MVAIAFILDFILAIIYGFAFCNWGTDMLLMADMSDMYFTLFAGIIAVVCSIITIFDEDDRKYGVIGLVISLPLLCISLAMFWIHDKFDINAIIGSIQWLAILGSLIWIQIRLYNSKRGVYIKLNVSTVWSIMVLTYVYAIYTYAQRDISLFWSEPFNSQLLPALSNFDQWTIEFKLLVGLGLATGLYNFFGTLRKGLNGAVFLLCLLGEALLIVPLHVLLAEIMAQATFILFKPIDWALNLFWDGWAFVFVLLPVAAFKARHGFTEIASGSTHIDDIEVDQGGHSFDLQDMPTIIYDSNNEQWIRQHVMNGHVVYANNSGRTAYIYSAQISGNSAVTDAGSFHWY